MSILVSVNTEVKETIWFELVSILILGENTDLFSSLCWEQPGAQVA